MSIVNVNQIQPVGSGQTVTINAANISAGSATVTAGTFIGNVTGNLTGSVNLTTGITTVAAGSTSAPSITPTGDNNTGIFFPSADTVCIGTGGSEVFRANSSFNVGINSTIPQTKLDVVGSIKGVITSGTSQASTSGANIDFTGIPSWVKRITVMFNKVSTNGSSDYGIRLGTGGTPTYATSGYSGGVGNVGGAGKQHPTTYAQVLYTANGTLLSSGSVTITTLGSNVWTISGNVCSDSTYVSFCGYSVTLSATLTAVRIITGNGTDTFDAGSINILYEG